MFLYVIIALAFYACFVCAYWIGKTEGMAGRCTRCTRNDITNVLRMRARHSCHNAD